MPSIEKYNDFIFHSVPVCREVNGVYEKIYKYKEVVKKIRDIEKRWVPDRPRLRVPRLTVLKQAAQLPPPPSGFKETPAPSGHPVFVTCVVTTAPSKAVKEGLQIIARNRKERARDVIPSRDWMSEFPELLEAWVKIGLKIRPVSIVPMVVNYVQETDWWRGVAVSAGPLRPPSRPATRTAWALSLKGILKELDRSRRVLRDSDDLHIMGVIAALVFGANNNVATLDSQNVDERRTREYVMFKGDSDFNVFSLS